MQEAGIIKPRGKITTIIIVKSGVVLFTDKVCFTHAGKAWLCLDLHVTIRFLSGSNKEFEQS